MKWKNTTNYSQTERDRTPREWTIEPAKGLRIIIHHYLGCGDAWFVSCHGINLSQRQLQNIDVEDAKSEALSVVYSRLAFWMAALEKIDPSKPGDGREV
jgi:hypothetical protein